MKNFKAVRFFLSKKASFPGSKRLEIICFLTSKIQVHISASNNQHSTASRKRNNKKNYKNADLEEHSDGEEMEKVGHPLTSSDFLVAKGNSWISQCNVTVLAVSALCMYGCSANFWVSRSCKHLSQKTYMFI